jgi:alkylhydroperoxidase/carboxymuconolactone decarboxylase family protein YurZ
LRPFQPSSYPRRESKETDMADGVQQLETLTDSPVAKLPDTATQAANEQPDLWRAFQHLAEEANRAGPLDARARRLTHLAMAISVGSEGATHSHTRRALAQGIKPAELEHVAWLAVTTLGWPQAIRGLTWIRDITRAEKTPLKGRSGKH